MSRKSASTISIDTNVRALKVYPQEPSKKSLTELKTVGIRLNRSQAIHLARVLLCVTQEWESLEITAYRRLRKSDGTCQVTVTTSVQIY